MLDTKIGTVNGKATGGVRKSVSWKTSLEPITSDAHAAATPADISKAPHYAKLMNNRHNGRPKLFTQDTP